MAKYTGDGVEVCHSIDVVFRQSFTCSNVQHDTGDAQYSPHTAAIAWLFEYAARATKIVGGCRLSHPVTRNVARGGRGFVALPSALALGHGETMTAAISTTARSEIMDRLERGRFDCAIIGGGISGAGIARAAARRGQSVALLEAEDFASGTSGRSSKLIHGGLRYLAMGDVALVRTTALERKEIHRLAPHLAVPRWTVVPTRSRAGLMKFRAGITTYEKLGAVEEKDLHRNWSGDELGREEPLLDRSRVRARLRLPRIPHRRRAPRARQPAPGGGSRCGGAQPRARGRHRPGGGGRRRCGGRVRLRRGVAFACGRGA